MFSILEKYLKCSIYKCKMNILNNDSSKYFVWIPFSCKNTGLSIKYNFKILTIGSISNPKWIKYLGIWGFELIPVPEVTKLGSSYWGHPQLSQRLATVTSVTVVTLASHNFHTLPNICHFGLKIYQISPLTCKCCVSI